MWNINQLEARFALDKPRDQVSAAVGRGIVDDDDVPRIFLRREILIYLLKDIIF